MLTIEKTETIVVPTLSLKEIDRITKSERATIVSDFEATEKEMRNGGFETYSPTWLHKRFLKIYDNIES